MRFAASSLSTDTLSILVQWTTQLGFGTKLVSKRQLLGSLWLLLQCSSVWHQSPSQKALKSSLRTIKFYRELSLQQFSKTSCPSSYRPSSHLVYSDMPPLGYTLTIRVDTIWSFRLEPSTCKVKALSLSTIAGAQVVLIAGAMAVKDSHLQEQA